MWNAVSLVQDLNLRRCVHLLRRLLAVIKNQNLYIKMERILRLLEVRCYFDVTKKIRIAVFLMH